MPDMTDDWMNPPTSRMWTATMPDNKTVFLIERESRVITFGDPLTEWKEWERFDTAEARDTALARLRAEHPVWSLRSREYNPYMDYIRNPSRL